MLGIDEKGGSEMGNRGGVAFVGCMILGTGIGMAFDQAGTGSVIGVGLGFLVMALLGKKSD